MDELTENINHFVKWTQMNVNEKRPKIFEAREILDTKFLLRNSEF